MNIAVQSTASALSLLQLGPAIVRRNCFGLVSLLMICFNLKWFCCKIRVIKMKGNFRNSIISGSSLFTFIPLYYILEYKMSVNIPKLHFLVDINMDINCQFCTLYSPCLRVYMSRQTVSTIIRVT